MTVEEILAIEKFGWNRHAWDLPPAMIVDASKILFAGKATFVLASTFTRLSLLCFYYRILKDSGIKWFRWVLHASVIWTVAIAIMFMTLIVFTCT